VNRRVSNLSTAVCHSPSTYSGGFSQTDNKACCDCWDRVLLLTSTLVITPTRREIRIFNNGRRLGKIEKYNMLFPVPVEKENP
jgi:hypothetical protein